MILDTQYADAFHGYAKPLEKLERRLNRARLPAAFRAFVAPGGIKMVEITGRNGKFVKLLCVEWASPAQAVEIVAAGVRV